MTRLAITRPSVLVPVFALFAACGGGGATRTATGAASPIVVTGLVNGTAYNCSVTATDAVGTSAASGQVQVRPLTPGTSYNTDGVLCTYTVAEFNSSPSVNANASAFWSCNPTRAVIANAIPNHPVGTFPNPANPNSIRPQQVQATFTLTPTVTSATGNNVMVAGCALNGVKFEPGTGGTCDSASPPNCTFIGGTGARRMEALPPSGFDFGTDSNNAHVQPTGEHHYHGLPTGHLALPDGLVHAGLRVCRRPRRPRPMQRPHGRDARVPGRHLRLRGDHRVPVRASLRARPRSAARRCRRPCVPTSWRTSRARATSWERAATSCCRCR